MNIGIDIDDTINNLHDILIKKGTEFNKKENIKYEIKDNEWCWDKAFGWDDLTAKKFLNENIENAYLNAGIKENASEVINKLHAEGNKIIIITSRGEDHCPNAYKISETWLKGKNVQFDKLIVGSIDKGKACVENKIDVFIDDHVDFCEGVAKTTTKVLMFNSPYNQQETKYKRVYDWNEVYREINL